MTCEMNYVSKQNKDEYEFILYIKSFLRFDLTNSYVWIRSTILLTVSNSLSN